MNDQKQYEIALVDYHNRDNDIKAMSEWFFVSEDEFNDLKYLARRGDGYVVILRLENQIVKEQLKRAKKFKKDMKKYEY